MTPGFWKDKTVLVTGHTGFKGSWLVLWLQNLGAKVIGYSLSPPTSPSLFDVANVQEAVVHLHEDIRDFDQLIKALKSHKPEIVFHMAAQSLVRHSYQNPLETYSTNVMGTVNLLEAVRRSTSVKSVVVVTSDKCYENREWMWGYRENERMGGHDPYSNSKGCAELVVSAYRQSFFNRTDSDVAAIASARAGNVIGGGDWANDRLIPDVITAATNGKSVLIRNPNSIRPWQHVLEPVSGYLALAERLFIDGAPFAEGWNFGPGEDDAQPVQWIIERFAELWGGGFNWETDKATHPHEAHYLKLDCSKAKELLKWQPRWSLMQALEQIVAWHKAHISGEDMLGFTLAQIDQYQESAIK